MRLWPGDRVKAHVLIGQRSVNCEWANNSRGKPEDLSNFNKTCAESSPSPLFIPDKNVTFSLS